MSVEQRLEKLERAIRRRRLLGIATSGLLVVVVCFGATGPDKKGGVLVLGKLVIRDSQGQERIVLGTFPDGGVKVYHLDAKGKKRIAVVTSPGEVAGAMITATKQAGKLDEAHRDKARQRGCFKKPPVGRLDPLENLQHAAPYQPPHNPRHGITRWPGVEPRQADRDQCR